MGKSGKIKVNKNVIVLHIVGDVWKDQSYYVFSTSNRKKQNMHIMQ